MSPDGTLRAFLIQLNAARLFGNTVMRSEQPVRKTERLPDGWGWWLALGGVFLLLAAAICYAATLLLAYL
nr:MAG: hypothetical protein DIU68_01050 [Chloroflexota bacterium]